MAQREVTFDLVVVGGGAGGVAAACAAARLGSRVALLEKYGFLGGLASSACVGTVCGLFARESKETRCVGAFANEFRRHLFEREARHEIGFGEGLFFVPYSPWAFEAVCQQLLSESGVELFLHTSCFATGADDARITYVDALVGNEPCRFHAAAFVDASGEGLLSSLSGAELLLSDSYQAPGFVFGVSNLSAKAMQLSERELSLQIIETLIRHKTDLDKSATRLSVVPGSLAAGQVRLKLAYATLRNEVFNELTEIESLGRNCLQAAFACLQQQLEYFREAQISFVAPQAGIRSGPRGKGRHVLSEVEVLSCARFDDAVAHGVWPLELWSTNQKAQLRYFTPGDYYQIPARALQSASLENLFFCGRGISADEAALSSARVIGTCLSTGYAAGTLAHAAATRGDIVEAVASLQRQELAL